MKNSLENISENLFVKNVLFNKWFLRVGFVFLIVAFSVISYGRAFDYYFWRDDGKVVWMQKYTPAIINSFDTLGTARGRIGAVVFDYMEYLFFGFESDAHQFFGFMLRLVNVFLLYFLAHQLFKSKKVAIVSCLIAAPFIGGLEAYSWVRGIGMMITLSLLSFTLYIKSYSSRNVFWFVGAAAASALALSMDIWRSLGIVLVIALWEVLHLLSKDAQLPKKWSLVRLAAFVGVQFAMLKFVLVSSTSAGGEVGSSANGYITMALEGTTIHHFFSSIGNLVRSPLLYIHEEGGITDAGVSSTILGVTFLVTLVTLFLRFLWKREKSLIPWIVLFVWIPLFYGPNWLYAQKLEVSSTHRYIAFSASVFPILWAKFLTSKVSARVGAVGILLLVIFGLLQAQSVVNHDYTVRGSELVVPIWKRVTAASPIGETNQILYVSGDNRVVGYVFAWSDVFPYATFKGIGSPSQLPIYAGVDIASEVLCNPKTQIHDPITGNFKEAGTGFAINKAYAWFIKDSNNFTETTDEFRINIAKSSTCLWKSQIHSFGQIQQITKSTVVPLKLVPDTYAFLTEWQKGRTSDSFHYVATLMENGVSLPIDIKVGKVLFEKDVERAISYVTFNLKRDATKQYFVNIFLCRNNCLSPEGGVVRNVNFNELLSISTPSLVK